MNALQLSDEQDRSVLVTDHIAVAPAAAMCATLNKDVTLGNGDSLPELWHWLYFWSLTKSCDLGIDGHPRKGGFLPNLGLPRRMWAGGRLRFHHSLEIGESATRRSTIANVDEKRGRSGRLGFVTVRHELMNHHGLAVEEEQDIVYREAHKQGASAPDPTPAPPDAVWQREISPTEMLLFRYSALTFNGHRIHYDRSYAAHEEGYTGLVVHGPLVATLLIDLIRSEMPSLSITTFSFRAIRPTLSGNPFILCGEPSSDGKSVELWAKDHDGWLTMRASATLE